MTHDIRKVIEDALTTQTNVPIGQVFEKIALRAYELGQAVEPRDRMIAEADTADVLAGENRVWRYYFAQMLANPTFAGLELETLAERADNALELTKRRGRLVGGFTPAVPEP